MNSKTAGSNLGYHIFLTALGILMLYPILWMVSSSFKPDNLIFTDTSLWPSATTLQHYVKGWFTIRDIQFGLFFGNSLKLSAISIAANVIACSMTAYAFARMEFTLKKFWFGCMLMTMMLPGHVTLIPQYIIFYKLNWLDSILPLIIPKILATDSFFILLMVQFFRGLPKELDESATIDGCGPVQIYLNIILPLAVPALITTAIFTFIWTWDDFFSQLLYLNNVKHFTVSLGLRLFLDASGESSWGALFAMSVLSLIPPILLFFTCQKYFVEGIATTGLKG